MKIGDYYKNSNESIESINHPDGKVIFWSKIVHFALYGNVFNITVAV